MNDLPLVKPEQFLHLPHFAKLYSSPPTPHLYMVFPGVGYSSALKDAECKSLRLMGQSLTVHSDCAVLTGSFMGAPFAVFLLEILVAWGVRQVTMVGTAGSIEDQGLHPGKILVCDRAIVDEGTSLQYGRNSHSIIPGDVGRTELTLKSLMGASLDAQLGTVASTDGIFRETAQKIASLLTAGANAVDMETSAVYSAALHLNCSAVSVLLITDVVSKVGWLPEFSSARVQDSRKSLISWLAGEIRK